MECRQIAIGIIAVTTTVLGSGIAAADGPPESSSAKELYERATVQFRLGRFRDAAQTYERVYEIHHDAAILYNIGQSYRLGDDPGKALFFYKSFLSTIPDSHNKDEVSKRIRELEQVIAVQRRSKERPPNEPEPHTDRAVTPPSLTAASPAPLPRISRRRWFWPVVSCAAAVVAGGIALGVVYGNHLRDPVASDGRVPGN